MSLFLRLRLLQSEIVDSSEIYASVFSSFSAVAQPDPEKGNAEEAVLVRHQTTRAT